MTHLKNLRKIGLYVVVLLATTGSKAQIIDQFDTSYNAGLSARTLPGYSWYQTFTAGITGNMTRIDIGFFNFISGSGTLEVYEDTGITGTLLYSSQVNVFCPGNGCLIPFQVNCNVVAGNRYTFHFIPGVGIPDPFGVQQDFYNTYPGGEMYTIDPSGTYPFHMDLIFATYVKPETTGINDAIVDSELLFYILDSSILLAKNVIGELYSMTGQKSEMTNLTSGIYILKMYSSSGHYIKKISIK